MTNIPVAERGLWVGSSESAALLGVSPFTTRFALFHEKSGNVARPDLDGLERIEAGRFLEPAIAAWAAHKWSWPVRKVTEYLVHPRVARMGASLDFETAAGEPVEIKNVDSSIFREKWVSEGDNLIEAPVHYLVQVQHQLACRPAASRGWIVACVGGNKLYRMPVDRHPALVRRIEAEVAAFWAAVDRGDEPAPDFEQDGETLSLLYPRGGGGSVDLTTHNRAPELCDAYLAGKADEKAAKARAEAALAEIKSLVGAASEARVTGFDISIADIPEGVVAASTRRAYRRFNVKRI